MKSSSRQLFGSQTTTYYPADLYPPGENVVLFTNPLYSEVFNVFDTGTTSGDFKHPNGIGFDKIQYSPFRGNYTVLSAIDDSLLRTDTGVLQYSVQPISYLPYVGLGAYESALSKLFDKIRGSADFSVDIGQLSQTRQMINNAAKTLAFVKSHPASALKRMYRDYLRLKPGSAKAVGSKWLEFQYGWKPMAQGIYDASISLQKSLPQHLVLTARSTMRNTESNLQNIATIPDIQVTEEISERCLISVRMTSPTSNAAFLADFTSLNPFSIAWELLPYSFIVDWFLDVGGYLRNIENALLYGANFESGFVTVTRQSSALVSVNSSRDDGTVKCIVSGFTSVRQAYKIRRVLAGMPFPEIPRIKSSLGSQRLLNTAALLSQHLKR